MNPAHCFAIRFPHVPPLRASNAQVVGRMNPASAVAAQAELASRLARVLGRDANGRLCPQPVGCNSAGT